MEISRKKTLRAEQQLTQAERITMLESEIAKLKLRIVSSETKEEANDIVKAKQARH